MRISSSKNALSKCREPGCMKLARIYSSVATHMHSRPRSKEAHNLPFLSILELVVSHFAPSSSLFCHFTPAKTFTASDPIRRGTVHYAPTLTVSSGRPSGAFIITDI